MRYLDDEEAAKIKARPWMLEALAMNPVYCNWGPYEDYMTDTKSQWGSRVVFDTWDDFGPWKLDCYNEIVNFYFDVDRSSKVCEFDCGGTGYNAATRRIADDWYDFAGTGRRWCDKITQDEAQALFDAGRLREHKACPDASVVNANYMQHDAINRMICVETRAKRLGVYGLCKSCKGEGYIYTEATPKLGLVLWVLHPRKGCSRGVHIKKILKSQLPGVIAYLRQAADRNADRFSQLKG